MAPPQRSRPHRFIAAALIADRYAPLVAIEDPQWPRADTWLGEARGDGRVAVVGVPTSTSSLSASQAWRAPQAIRAALARFATFDSEHRLDLRDLAVVDLGDWAVAGLDMHEAQSSVATAGSQLAAGPIYCFFGGDNAITRPLVRSLFGGDLTKVGVLTIDAHHDVRTTDRGPTNGSPIRGLIEDGLPDGRVVQVGIHSFANSAAYREYCDDHRIEVITMDVVDEIGAGWAVSSALNDLAGRCEWIYVDIDVDVLDVAFAPGCPGSRPGGMTPRQLAAAAYAAGSHPAVRAADIVEVDPARDPSGITVLNAASAFLSFASGIASRSGS